MEISEEKKQKEISNEINQNRKQKKTKKSKKSKKSRRSKHSPDYSNEKNSKEERSSKKLYLPIHLYFFSEMINHLINDQKNILSEIKTQTGVRQIELDSEIHLTDLGGKVITIFDKSRRLKEKAVDLVLDEYELFNKNTPNYNSSLTSLIILIPEAFVSLFIGYKGSQIKRMMSLHATKIVVNQPIQNVSFRTVEISGRADDVRLTCKDCIKSLQDVAREKKINKLHVKPKTQSLRQSRTMAKLVVHSRTVKYFDEPEQRTISKIQEEFKVKVNVYSNFKLRFLKPSEKILQIEGKLENVQQALTKTIKSINSYAEESMAFNFERTMLVIPSLYITKLIGAGGCMIREIAAKSGGAQIKILSNRETERDYRVRECPVSIAGSLVNKQDAACLILEKIELFKSGGPVLVSGKVLGKNIATQFKHSIQAKDGYDKMLIKRGSIERGESKSGINQFNDSKACFE